MLRDPNLVSFSHQHQHALALCVRIDRALQSPELDIEMWQEEIVRIYDEELEAHFEGEERFVFPAAAGIKQLRDLLVTLNADHTRLRVQAMEARQRQLDREGLASFGKNLAEHVRAEERVLFERMQEFLSAPELERVKQRTNDFLANSGRRS